MGMHETKFLGGGRFFVEKQINMTYSAPESLMPSRRGSLSLTLPPLPASAPGSQLQSFTRLSRKASRTRRMRHSATLAPISSAGNAWTLREPSMEGHTYHAAFGNLPTHRGEGPPLQRRGSMIEPTLPECAVHSYGPVSMDTFREGRATSVIIGTEPTRRTDLPVPVCHVHVYDPPQGTLRYGMMSVGPNAAFSRIPRAPRPQKASTEALYRAVPLAVYREVSHRGSTFSRESRRLISAASAA